MAETGHGRTGTASEPKFGFAATALQCLGHNHYIRTFFSSRAYASFKLGKTGHEKCVTCGLAFSIHMLIVQMWSNKYSCVNLDPVLDKIREHYQTTRRRWPQLFSSTRKEDVCDAQDFIKYMLEVTHDSYNKGDPQAKRVSPTDSAAFYNYMDARNKSRIWEVYRFYLVETLDCYVCFPPGLTSQNQEDFKNNIIYTFVNFGGLVLPMNQEDKLEQLLDTYFTEPKRSTLYCEKCKQDQKHAGNIKMYTMPNTLIIVLQRLRGSFLPKVDRQVAFPTKGLDMSKYYPKNITGQSPSKYDLCAVINHKGDYRKGTYSVFAKGDQQIGWREFDGHDVRQIQENSVQTKDAYILFYNLVR